MSYFDQHRTVLRQLFHVLGKDDDWSDDPELFVSHTLPRWLGTEHGQVGDKEPFTDSQILAARPLLSQLGLTDRVDPPQTRYDEVVVLGAAAIGLHRRLELVRTSGVRAEVLTVLAGMRPHPGAAGRGRDGGIRELLASAGRFAATDGWKPPALASHLADLLSGLGVNDDDAARIVLPSETAIAKLLLAKHWPSLQLREIRVPDSPHEHENTELGQREILWYEWSGPPELPRVRLLNGQPVARPHGPPRPTTASTIEEWLESLPAAENSHSVLFVVNQPHLGRVALTLKELLSRQVAPRIEFDIAGCETLTDVSIHLLLGELPARIASETTSSAAAEAAAASGGRSPRAGRRDDGDGH